MAGITLFLPAGGVGIVAGCAIGIYLSASLKNILDEIFGKGAYREILIAGGYTMGTAMNLAEALQQFKRDREAVAAITATTQQKIQNTKNILDILDERRSV
jgi:NhaP-type Na+/H+ or K+/H+ antiporter